MKKIVFVLFIFILFANSCTASSKHVCGYEKPIGKLYILSLSQKEVTTSSINGSGLFILGTGHFSIEGQSKTEEYYVCFVKTDRGLIKKYFKASKTYIVEKENVKPHVIVLKRSCAWVNKKTGEFESWIPYKPVSESYQLVVPVGTMILSFDKIK